MARRRTALLLVLVAAGTVAVYVTAFMLDTTRDDQATLDVEPVRGAAERACTMLRADLDALPPLPAGSSAADRLARLDVQDREIVTLISSVRSVGVEALRKDVPVDEWLADWTALADARRAYAAAGAVGPWSPPVVDGRLLTERMGRIGVPACVVPTSLTVAP